uniref:Glycosyltransferase family 92 n=1 Tax=Mimivirus LCMiAC02 TaxID=2506609 RepID=A0A481Z3V7_9VIRU|nr:MAG: glycosyltransferase family 92 [Mimivirus LCMiAC02]
MNNIGKDILKYSDINSFKLSKDKFLFFDIFYKNNEVILICPVYNRSFPYLNKIQIKHDNNILKIKKKIVRIGPGPIVILVFDIVSNDLQSSKKFSTESTKKNQIFEFEVICKNITKKYTLYHASPSKTKMLTLTTLFKYDYKLINIFYDYYKKQGVEYFYLYYNGKLTDDIINLYNKPDIKLIEWDFKYWSNCRFPYNHHAQMGQLHHAMYKYGKNEAEYMIFNDLDEYMYIPNKRLIELVSDKKYDTYGFCNYWSNTLDNKTPSEFPNKFKIGNKIKFGNRSKCIHKLDTIDSVGIHIGRDYSISNPKKDCNYMLFHFCKWGKRFRGGRSQTNFRTHKIFEIKYNSNKNDNIMK